MFHLFLLALFLFPGVVHAQAPAAQQDVFIRGKVLNIIKEFETEDGGLPLYRQELLVQLTDGEQKGKEMRIVYDLDLDQRDRTLEKGQRVVVGKNSIAGEETYYISDVYRLRSLWLLVLGFVVLTVALTRSYGARALAGLLFSFIIIIYFIVPFILDGHNPLLIATSGTIGIACVALFMAHGFHARTTIAFVSTLITLLLSLALATLFVRMMQLTGIGTEEAFYLQFAPVGTIDLRGLLLAGIMIGALGVLDDITTAQAAAVEQIHKADTTLKMKELYQRGFAVGREHITSLVNTLVLAYTGVSLPLLLLFQIYERPVWVTLNSEIVLEEVIRMLVGSIALILAVPITTALAAWYFGSQTEKK